MPSPEQQLAELDQLDNLVRKSTTFKKIRGSLLKQSQAGGGGAPYTPEEILGKSPPPYGANGRSSSSIGSAHSSHSGGARSRDIPDDGSTVYGVDVDARSVASTPNRNKPAKSEPYMLKIILLLMDMKSRRFELLQLEFDSNKATVQNVLSQVPVAVADPSLRSLDYYAVCDHTSIPKEGNVLLNDFCAGDDILVALPRDGNIQQVIKKAIPILNDSKVVKMLESGGISTEKWSRSAMAAASSTTAAAASPSTPAPPSPAPPSPAPPSTPQQEESKPRSTPQSSSSASGKTFMLKVILLLMDPTTRRFELLQLEFDSNKALVSDVLSQIPVAVTEQILRTQSYVGICDSSTTQRLGEARLSDFCEGNDVLVAIPKGISPEKCAKLARPIIQDMKVTAMLRASGVDPDRWKKPTPGSAPATPAKGPAPSAPATPATPAARSAPSTPATSASTSQPAIKSRDIGGMAAPAAKVAEPTKTTTKSSSSSSSSYRSRANVKTSSPVKKGSPLKQVFIGLVLSFWVAVFLQLYHVYLAAPIGKGHVLAPGITLSKCGIYSKMDDCNSNNSFLEMNADGNLNFYNQDKELVWRMTGGVCPPGGGTNCLDGLKMDNQGYLTIGGRSISQILTKDNQNVDLSPWPFITTPSGLRKKKL